MNNEHLEKFVANMHFMLKNLPGYFFIKDNASHYVELSNSIEQDLNVTRKRLIGRSDFEAPWECLAEQYRHNDSVAMEKKISDVFEPIVLGKSCVLTSHCVRLPITDNIGEVVGVFGQTEVLSVHPSLKSALQALHKIEKKNSLFQKTNKNLANIQLTSRETESLSLMIRGRTAKEIGRYLGISYRTVATYIENIKNKMGVTSRSELIDKAINLGIINMIYINQS